ncbi:MAG TPA: SRPBCC family protein [Thermoleophilaceae bacterium]
MTAIIETIEVDRAPEDVFSYVTDPSRFGEWQQGVVDGHMEGNGQTAVGTRCVTTRRIGLAERSVTAEVTKFEPPRTWAVHGIEGPIRATVNVGVEPLDQRARSRVTIDIDFEGHGIGKLLVPLVVRRGAQKEMPENLRRLKQRLESDA